jgi:hypothetical protein
VLQLSPLGFRAGSIEQIGKRQRVLHMLDCLQVIPLHVLVVFGELEARKHGVRAALIEQSIPQEQGRIPPALSLLQ